MKKLVVYYSRTKTTKRIAEELANKIDADIEELVDKKKRDGAGGYIIAGKDAIQKKLADIEEVQIDPRNYDLIIFGTPVWVGTMAPAIRTYINQHKGDLHKVAFFTTQGGSNRQKVFSDLVDLIDRQPVSELMLTTKEVVQNEYNKKLEEFINKIK